MKGVTRTLALVAVLALGACGGGGGSGVASLGDGAGAGHDATDPADQALEWAQCMREHGVDVPDPEVDDGGRILIGGPAPEDGGAEEAGPIDADGPEGRAFAACRDLLPAMEDDLDPDQRAALEDGMYAYARCMREHGVDVPDPKDGGFVFRMDDERAPDPSSPEFQEADRACAPILRDAERRAGIEPPTRTGG